MITYGRRSKQNIDELHPKLQKVLRAYSRMCPRDMDLSIVVGHRNEIKQTAAFDSGNSKVQWPNSQHNSRPSRAFDFILYPFDGKKDWKDGLRFARTAGGIMLAAGGLDIKLRWGGDWDQDGKSNDQKFMDLGHVELDRDEL